MAPRANNILGNSHFSFLLFINHIHTVQKIGLIRIRKIKYIHTDSIPQHCIQYKSLTNRTKIFLQKFEKNT